MVIGKDGKVLSFEAGRATEAGLLALLRDAITPGIEQPQPIWGATEPRRPGRFGRGKASGDEVSPPELIHKIDPGYTPEAQKAKISGTVMLAILIGTDGTVSDIRVIGTLDPGLDARAISAVSKWQFKPATRGGTPVAFRARAGVTFSEQ
jgi:protein TonB